MLGRIRSNLNFVVILWSKKVKNAKLLNFWCFLGDLWGKEKVSLWKSFKTRSILWKSSPQVVELGLFLFSNYFVNTSDGRTRKSRKKAKKTATSNWKSSLPPPPLHSESEQLLLLSAIGVVATVEVSVEEAPDVGQFDSSSCATTSRGGRWAFAKRGRSITKWKHNTLVRSRIISTKCAFLVLLFKDLWDAGLNKISLLFSLRCVCVRNFSHPAWGAPSVAPAEILHKRAWPPPYLLGRMSKVSNRANKYWSRREKNLAQMCKYIVWIGSK